MKRTIKNYKNFLIENEVAEPKVKPGIRTAPSTRPNRPSPLRKNQPSVNPKPKATADKLADKFLSMVKNNSDIQELLKNKYNN